MPAASVSCSTEVLRSPSVTAQRRASRSSVSRMAAFSSAVIQTRLRQRRVKCRRQEVKELIESLSERYPDLKQKLFGAMQRYPLYGWDVKNSEK